MTYRIRFADGSDAVNVDVIEEAIEECARRFPDCVVEDLTESDDDRSEVLFVFQSEESSNVKTRLDKYRAAIAEIEPVIDWVELCRRYP